MNSVFRPLFIQSLHSSGIYLLIIALTLAISATTALKFSNQQVQQAVALQAAELQAADLVLSDHQPLPLHWQQQAQKLQLQQSQVTVFNSMAYTRDQFVMVNVKAIDAAFPLRGKLQVAGASASRIQPGQVWLSSRAMELLRTKVGDSIHIADGIFRVAGKIARDPNQELGFSGFSPTVIIHQQDIAKTHAIQVGSRIEYRLLMAGPPEKLQQYQRYFQQMQQHAQPDDAPSSARGLQENSSLHLRSASESNVRLVKPMENLDIFLQLANILTILLCGIAIALTSQRYVLQNQDAIALMRCIGAAKRQILWSYLVILGLVMLVAILLGSAIGVGLGYGLLALLLQLIPSLQLQFSMLEMLLGPLPIAMLTSTVVMLGFILPSLWQLLNTPPIRVIRQQEKSAQSMLWMLSAGLISLIGFSVILTERVLLTLSVVGAIIVLSILLYGVVWGILKWIRAGKNRLSAYVRTPYQTAFQITALALGLSLITVLVVLRNDLLERWQQQLPEGTPNQFVYGLPPLDMPAFQQKLQAYGWHTTPLYPNIRGRLIAKNGQPFAKELIEHNNSLRRELNLTQASIYPADNQIVQGQASFDRVGQVSVEQKTAQELGILVGDKLTFSLPEGELQATVINLRQVEWESFSPNFFFIFSPQSMDANAGSYLGSFYVPPQDKAKLVSLIQQYSNTVFIDVSLILDEIKRLVNILVQIMTILALLVSLAGFLVLLACLNLLMEERKREVALLRSFGASKVHLKRMLSLEVGFLGLLAGIMACLFAEMISAIASYKMNLAIQAHPLIWLILPLLMSILCALIGRYRLGYLSEIPPLQSLRELS